MRGFHKVLLTLAALTLAASPALAATQTTTMDVSAQVQAECSVSASSLDFGTYSPLSDTDLDAQATITVTCTSGASAWVGLDEGTNSPDGTTRALSNGTDTLTYELYSDAARTTVWGNDAASGAAVTGTGAAQTLDVYGRITASQNVSVGTYTDTITVTVNF